MKYKNIQRYIYFIFLRSYFNLKSESKGLLYGILWWTLEPIVTVFVYLFVFGTVLAIGNEDYPRILIIGVVVWSWINNSVNNSLTSIYHSGVLMNQVYIPKIVLPLVHIFTDFYKQILTLLILLIFLYFFGALNNKLSLLNIVILTILLMYFIISVSLIGAIIVPFFPETKFIIGFLMNIIMMGSGIFYNSNMIPHNIASILEYNPVFVIIEQYRNVFLQDYGLIDYSDLIYVLIFSSLLLLVSSIILYKFDKVYPRISI
jgi:ABC-type polysaccharide/polyol phosphate export permease